MYAPANANMNAGSSVEDYCSSVVVDALSESEAFAHALARLDSHQSPDHMPDDPARVELFRDTIVYQKHKKEKGMKDAPPPTALGTHFELTCKHALEGIREATQGANGVVDGRRVSVDLDGVELPFVGELDYEAPYVVELKTQWPYIDSKSKQGWRTNSVPSKPKYDHCRQVALYWKWLKEAAETVPVKIVYANSLGYRVFSSDDCDELTEENLREYLDSLRIVAKARENLLRTAADKEQLFNLVMPDFSHFMWRDKPPEYLSKAKQLWGA